MDSLDAFIYQEVWKYCLHKSGGRAKPAYSRYTLPLTLNRLLQVGLVLGEQVIRLPRLSSIPRKSLKLGYHHLPILCQDGITLFPIQVQPMSNGGTNTSGVVRKVSGLVKGA